MLWGCLFLAIAPWVALYLAAWPRWGKRDDLDQ